MLIKRTGSNTKKKKKKKRIFEGNDSENYFLIELPEEQNPIPQAVTNYFLNLRESFNA